MEELQNPQDNSIDNDKSRAVDATESDKSDAECDQVDQTPLGIVPETCVIMDEAKHAPWDQAQEEVKVEDPDQGKERSGAENRQQSDDQEPKELISSSLLTKRTSDQF